MPGPDAPLDTRIDAVLATFPVLAQRLGARAGDLSGGQQQMLSLGMALLARPRVLLVDELSLGLAPAVVARAARRRAGGGGPGHGGGPGGAVGRRGPARGRPGRLHGEGPGALRRAGRGARRSPGPAAFGVPRGRHRRPRLSTGSRAHAGPGGPGGPAGRAWRSRRRGPWRRYPPRRRRPSVRDAWHHGVVRGHPGGRRRDRVRRAGRDRRLHRARTAPARPRCSTWPRA